MSRNRSLRRGTKPSPPVRLTSEFVGVICSAGHTKSAMAAVAGFRLPHFSTLLYADRVPGTPLLERRLTTLASALNFRGDVVESCR